MTSSVKTPGRSTPSLPPTRRPRILGGATSRIRDTAQPSSFDVGPAPNIWAAAIFGCRKDQQPRRGSAPIGSTQGRSAVSEPDAPIGPRGRPVYRYVFIALFAAAAARLAVSPARSASHRARRPPSVEFDNVTSSYKVGACSASFFSSPNLGGSVYPDPPARGRSRRRWPPAGTTSSPASTSTDHCVVGEPGTARRQPTVSRTERDEADEHRRRFGHARRSRCCCTPDACGSGPSVRACHPVRTNPGFDRPSCRRLTRTSVRAHRRTPAALSRGCPPAGARRDHSRRRQARLRR